MNSLEIYECARKNTQTLNTADAKNYYFFIVTAVFYELVTARESALISKFCRDYEISFDSKNFTVDSKTDAEVIHPVAPMDIYIIIYGVVFAFSSLDNSSRIFDMLKDKFLRDLPVNDKELSQLMGNFKRLDESIGNFFDKAAPKVEVSPAAETQTEIVRAAYDENFITELNKLASARTASDEKIIGDIKNLQLNLQEELKAVQSSLKNISDLRDDIDFRTVKAPLEQLLNLIDKLNDTLSQHPNETDGKGYAQLIRRCNSFSRYLLQALTALGAEIINETGVTINPDEHEVFGNASLQAKVVKVTRVGCRYKNAVIRKAEVEVEEPAGGIAQSTAHD